jgi:hypothetical protein
MKKQQPANIGFGASGHKVRTEKVLHLVNFIAGMQLVVSNAHQHKAPFVGGNFI